MANNYFKPTPAKWKKLQLGLKTIIGTVAVSSYVNNNPKTAFFVMVGGMLVNELIDFFVPEDAPTSTYKSVADNINPDKFGKN